jgi:hypothetical protein
MLKFIFASIILFGLIGNLLNIIIYSKANIRKSSLTFQLLLSLSITDFIILLLCGIESSIEYQFEIGLRAYSLIACKLDTFLAYFLTQTRNFLSMAITIESKINFFQIFSQFITLIIIVTFQTLCLLN